MTHDVAKMPVDSGGLKSSKAPLIEVCETRIAATDGYGLAATIYAPAERNDSVAIVNSATAVPRQFYRHYAMVLAESGFLVVTYDYRGIGGSRPTSLKGFDASMSDWVFKDMTSVLAWAQEQGPSRVVFVGHSFGGQTPGLLEHGHTVSAMLTLSAQSGHWRLQGAGQRLPVLLHTHLTLPLLTRVFGYMPWSRFGSAEDLPSGVALEWSRWCKHQDYLLGDSGLPLERYRDFAAPVRAYSIADDSWGSAPSVDAMMSAYPAVERSHLEPSAEGLSRLGHFGYFRPHASTLWANDIAWLQQA